MKLAQATCHVLWKSSMLIPISVEILEILRQGCHNHLIISSSESPNSGETIQFVDKHTACPFLHCYQTLISIPEPQAVSVADFYWKSGTMKKILHHSQNCSVNHLTVLKFLQSPYLPTGFPWTTHLSPIFSLLPPPKPFLCSMQASNSQVTVNLLWKLVFTISLFHCLFSNYAFQTQVIYMKLFS